MNKICYRWDNAIFSWSNMNLTWKEACLVARLSGTSKTVFHKKYKQLSEEEKKVVIGLIVRLKSEGYEIEHRYRKTRPNDVFVDIDEIEIFFTEPEKITVKVTE